MPPQQKKTIPRKASSKPNTRFPGGRQSADRQVAEETLPEGQFRVCAPASERRGIFISRKHQSRVGLQVEAMRTLGIHNGDLVYISCVSKVEKQTDAAHDSTKDKLSDAAHDFCENTPLLAVAWISDEASSKQSLILGHIGRRNIPCNVDDIVCVGKAARGSNLCVPENISVASAVHATVHRVVDGAVEPQAFNISDPAFSVYVKGILGDQLIIQTKKYYQAFYRGHQVLVEISRIDSGTTLLCDDDLAGRIGNDTRIVIASTDTGAPAVPLATKTHVSFASLGGLEKQLAVIKETAHVVFNTPEMLTQYKLRPPRGILLYGPPGTGKTLLARAAASETGATAFFINASDIVSKYIGETETRLRDIFERAADVAPSLIFIDEIDALCKKRESTGNADSRIVGTLLTLMDGISSSKDGKPNSSTSDRVLVIAATNRPNDLDDALRRPGRFDRELEIGIPSPSDRLDILTVLLRNTPNTCTPSDLEQVARLAHGYVGADLAAVRNEAGLLAIQRHVSVVYPII